MIGLGCSSSPTSPTTASNPVATGDESRQSSGTVELPGSTQMDITLRIERRAANPRPAGLTFVATLIA